MSAPSVRTPSKAVDPKALLKELVGTDAEFDADEITELLRSIIVTAFADLIGSSKVAVLDLAAHYRELSDNLRKKVVVERVDDEYGLDIPQLMIVNVSLPEEVEKAVDTRSSMGIVGDMNQLPAVPDGPGHYGRRQQSRRAVARPKEWDWAWASRWPTAWPA